MSPLWDKTVSLQLTIELITVSDTWNTNQPDQWADKQLKTHWLVEWRHCKEHLEGTYVPRHDSVLCCVYHQSILKGIQPRPSHISNESNKSFTLFKTALPPQFTKWPVVKLIVRLHALDQINFVILRFDWPFLATTQNIMRHKITSTDLNLS